MRRLFTIDKKDYDPAWRRFVRPSVRAIIIRDGKVAMVHSLKYDYYKFPGGGIEKGESRAEALVREVREESGLSVIPSSIREFGSVMRIQRSGTDKNELFIQDNLYYTCDIYAEGGEQRLDDYEEYERFTLEYISPVEAISVNRGRDHGPKDPAMIERESRVLEIIENELLSDSFRERVYECVRQIPKGKVSTYGQIAALAGNPRAARAVGNALHVNPDGDGTPCYRVVNSEGKLSGAFAFGGINVQKQRLEADGIEVKDMKVDIKKYLWQPFEVTSHKYSHKADGADK